MTGRQAWRLEEEEAFLYANLPGYAACRDKVRARREGGVSLLERTLELGVIGDDPHKSRQAHCFLMSGRQHKTPVPR